MSYLVSEILEDVIERIGRKVFTDRGGEPFLLRRMNKTYQRINMDNYICRKEYQADWSIYTENTLVDYVSLPDDWIKPYKMLPYMQWRLPNVWLNDDGSTKHTWYWDFVNGSKRCYMSNAAITSVINFKYYSSGLTLVNADPVSDSTTQTNEPEWPEELKQLLYFETIMALNVALTDNEIRIWRMLTSRMSAMRVSAALQATGPADGGEQARRPNVSDVYSRTS